MAASEETQRGSTCGELLSLKPAFGTLASALPGPLHHPPRPRGTLLSSSPRWRASDGSEVRGIAGVGGASRAEPAADGRADPSRVFGACAVPDAGPARRRDRSDLPDLRGGHPDELRGASQGLGPSPPCQCRRGASVVVGHAPGGETFEHTLEPGHPLALEGLLAAELVETPAHIVGEGVGSAGELTPQFRGRRGGARRRAPPPAPP